MTPASEWRMSLAQALVRRYAANAHVSAAFAGGSTARGHADRYSDLELCVVWSDPPTEAERGEVVARAGADLHRLYPYDGREGVWEDLYFVGRDGDDTPKSGCQVEVGHFLQGTLEASLDRVLSAYDPDPGLQNLMAGILDGAPLLNAPLLEGWKARLREYPDDLQVAVLNRYGIIDHLWRWEMFVARGDNRMELSALLTGVLHSALHLLLGLNRVYYGGFKWLDAVIARLPLAPRDLGGRIRRVYALPPAEAADEVSRIVVETFALIETHVPSVDVDRFRQVFFYRRPQWEDAPPLGLPGAG